jgi:predicted transcriptional regulator
MTRAPKEETAGMLALRKSGMTYQQIADRYGLHFNTVIKRLGLKPDAAHALPATGRAEISHGGAQ